MTKIVERKCPIGKWRFVFRDIMNHEVIGVSLKGQRRPWPLWEISKEQFLERVPKDQNGNPYEAATTLWSVPTMYMHEGQYIYIWPAPAHEWTLQLELKEKEVVT